jgi:uncharacterized protein (DUF934 family)
VLRRLEIVEDDWRHLGEEPPGGGEALIIPFAELRDNGATWEAWRGRLGLQLEPADRVEDLAPFLPRLSLVAIAFPGPGEGRGYSQARLLRQRLRFKGELRAVGHVKQDQIFFMARVGFDCFELAPGEKFDDAIAALQRYAVAYQAADAALPVELR